MEVADRLAIINEGRLEQVGAPADIYDHPANDFVLKFLGPATELDGLPVRPHDLVLHCDPIPVGRRATVERVTHLGFEVRVDLCLEGGEAIWVQLSRGNAAELRLAIGDVVFVSRSEPSLSTPAPPVPGAGPGGATGGAPPVPTRPTVPG